MTSRKIVIRARGALCVAAALSLFGFVACGDSSDPSTGTGSGTTGGGGGATTGGGTAHTVDTLPLACTLFTHEIAAKLTKETLPATGAETVEAPRRYCAWSSTSGTASYSLQVAWADGDASDADVVCTRDKGQKVTGVGSYACFYPSATAGGGGNFFALSGSYALTLTASDGSSDSLGAVVTQIVANLPKG